MLKKPRKIQAVLIAVLALLLAFTGCGANQTGELQAINVDDASTGGAVDAAFLAEVKAKASDIEQYSDYKSGKYQTVTLDGDSISFTGTGAEADGSTLTITKAGTYEISGVLSDGRIVVDTEDGEDVRLILNHAEITSSNGPSIYVKNAENTIVSLPPGTKSTLTDGSSNTYDEEATGALFSKDDLVINGSGTLTVNGNFNDGISGNDDLEITQATLIVTAVDDAVTANDSVSIDNINITVNAGGDGFKASNDTEADKGWIAVISGSFDINSGSDGLEAQTLLYIQDGSFTIDSEEGIESKSVIQLSGGTMDLTSSDDGINAGKTLTISGGDIRVNASGDGIDANGSVYMTGGTVLLSGPTDNGNGTLDYNGVFEISGGTLLAAGSSGMAMVPSGGSTQYTIANTVGTQAAGTEVRLDDSSSKTVASFTPEKDYQIVIISSPEIKNGNTYTLYAGDTKIADIAVSSVVSGDAANSGGLGGPGGGMMPGDGQGRPDWGTTSGGGIGQGRPDRNTSGGGIGPGGERPDWGTTSGGGMQGRPDRNTSGGGIRPGGPEGGVPPQGAPGDEQADSTT
jgi:hypothetical protein